MCIRDRKMQEQLLEREEVIFSKEEACKGARDEQINLENFRYMLDQKIKSLMTDKDGMLKKIEEKERILKDMFGELIKESSTNDRLFQESKKVSAKILVLQRTFDMLGMEIFFWINKTKELLHNFNRSAAKKQGYDKFAVEMREYLDKSDVKQDIKHQIWTKKGIKTEEIMEMLKKDGSSVKFRF
eukprot:TRINITY_DN6918_c0_g1_i1.p1 TRINITY_DN6918_c0_g1~~TRINITY_DN6918_c0_g1_i1.p1  ORF type:complete len:185 (-),score=69.21 TRINITY_DN6918_c0_g1_i1:90-644(-)